MQQVASVPVRDAEVPGIPVVVLQYQARTANGGGQSIRRAREGDLESCIALINRTHAGRDLFRPYSLEFFSDRLSLGYTSMADMWSPPYTVDDVYLAERSGSIVACAGLWDRGRDLRERWRHRESGDEKVVTSTALLDIGFARGREDE